LPRKPLSFRTRERFSLTDSIYQQAVMANGSIADTSLASTLEQQCGNETLTNPTGVTGSGIASSSSPAASGSQSASASASGAANAASVLSAGAFYGAVAMIGAVVAGGALVL
jgi:hypothetical protein